MALVLMYITNEPEVAKIAQKYGVDRVWVDLEYKGKDIRQAGMSSVKNHHTVEDVKAIRKVITSSEVLVRINPWNAESIDEINSVINAGADSIMLPMWKTLNEVSLFVNSVGNRAKKVLLLETKEAVDCLEDVLQLSGIDEIHIGLNDLHLSYGLSFMFQLVSNGTVESIISKIKTKGIPYGFGGIARIGEGRIPAEMIVMEHYRMGSTRAILSRSFCDYSKISDKSELDNVFKENIHKLREFEKKISSVGDEEFSKNKTLLELAVAGIVDNSVIKKKGE